MSTNLTCEEFEPVQTPSWITDLILSYDDDGNYDGGWKGVYRRYVFWLEYIFQETFNSVPRWNWEHVPLCDLQIEIKQEQEWQRTVHRGLLKEAKEAYESAIAQGRELHWGLI